MIKIQNQNNYKDQPILKATGKYRYANEEEGKKNWTDTAQDILDGGSDLINAGKEGWEKISTGGVTVGGTNIKLGDTTEDTSKEKKILGMSKPVFYTVATLTGLVGIVVAVRYFGTKGKKGKKASV